MKRAKNKTRRRAAKPVRVDYLGLRRNSIVGAIITYEGRRLVRQKPITLADVLRSIDLRFGIKCTFWERGKRLKKVSA